MRDEPEFGPTGYVPERAARRARKIVLREPMGLGWPAAAAVAALLVGVVGVIFFLVGARPPQPPFAPIVTLAEVPSPGLVRAAAGGLDVLVVQVTGGPRAFVAPRDAVAYCPQSRRLEAAGSVWRLDGQLVGGDGASLQPLHVRMHDGAVYASLDQASAPPPMPPAAAGEQPSCRDGSVLLRRRTGRDRVTSR